MATSPAPDAAAPPGMCPGVVVLGGGGGSGGEDGDGAGGDGDGNGAGDGSGDGAGGDGKGAPGGSPDTDSASDPVDVVTGRVFTLPATDVWLPGPLPLELTRNYSSFCSRRDTGLGWGWSCSWGWEIEVRRRRLLVWTHEGIAVDFGEPLAVGAGKLGPWGYLLQREAGGFTLDIGDGLARRFAPAGAGGSRHRLTAIEDRNRNRITLAYENGVLVRVVDSVGRILRITSTAEGRIAAIDVQASVREGHWARFIQYTYSDAGDLTCVTDAERHEASYAYDSRHLLTGTLDRVGLRFQYVYDRKRRCTEVWGDYPGRVDPCLADGLPRLLRDGVTVAKGIYHCKIEYGPGGYTEVADSSTLRRFFGSDLGLIEKSIDGRGVITRAYDAAGHLISRTDGRRGVTTFVRDARGRVLATTDPLGRTTRIERDSWGDPVQITNARLGVSRARRDERGNVIAASDELSATTFHEVDERGQIASVTSPGGGTWRVQRDAHGNQIGAVAPDGARWSWEYNFIGVMLASVDPTGRRIRYEHSARRDLLAKHTPEGTTRYSYDGEGHIVRIEAPGGVVRALEWGGFRQLCATTNENGHVVRLKYDRDGEAVEVHNERGEVHHLSYDVWHRLVEERTFDGRVFRYGFDEAGDLRSIEDSARQKTVFSRDLGGNIVAIERPGGAVDRFDYDALGAIVAISSAAGRCQLERDPVGRIVREEQTVGSGSFAVETEWSALGDPIARRTPSGYAELITRDGRGQRTRTAISTGLTIDHDSDVLGREVRRSFSPGGGSVATGYTGAGQIASRRVISPVQTVSAGPGEPEWIGPQPDAAWGRAYRYDARDELVESWDRQEGPTRYDYDPRGQLLAARKSGAREELFRYDPTGDIEEASSAATPWLRGAGGRLLRRGDDEYLWDELGRLIERRTRGGTAEEARHRYGWNDRDLLAWVTTPDGLRLDFQYDPLARRVEKRVSRLDDARRPIELSVTRYGWDRNRMIEETTQIRGGAPQGRTYVFEDDELVPMAHQEHDAAQSWLCYVTDPAGAPEALTRPDGTVAGVLDRRVWGQATMRSRPGAEVDTPLRFQGQYEDRESGLFYNRFRYYDPETARYTSPDPSGLLGGIHPYRYARNPLRWVDPFGLVIINAGARNYPFPDNPDEFILRGHGKPDGVKRPFDSSARSAAESATYWSHDEKELADYIRNHPDYKPGMTVRLAGCKTAQGPNSITDRLAKEMAADGSAVYGTTANLHVKPNGKHTIYTCNDRNGNVYSPGGWRKGGEEGPAPGPAGYFPSTAKAHDPNL